MNAFRAIQAKAAESGNPLNAQAIAQLVSAMKSGNLGDMQQIKNLFSLQQQQKQGQASMNPAAAAAAMQAQQGQGSGTDQLLLAAMRQQMLQQNQGQGQAQVNNGQHQQQQQQQQHHQRTQSGPQPQHGQQPQNQSQAPNQNQNRSSTDLVWSGNLIWNPNPTTKRKSSPTSPYLAYLCPVALHLDAKAAGGSQISDYKTELWGKDLVISNITPCTVHDLQTYSRATKAPFAIFGPAAGSDHSNIVRYTNMAKSLHSGSQVSRPFRKIGRKIDWEDGDNQFRE
jgi:hypothetical protein